jgi:cytochrome b561
MLRAPEKPRAIWIALALAWVLTAVRFAATRALEATALNFLQSHVYFGALILLVLMHRLRRPAAAEARALA